MDSHVLRLFSLARRERSFFRRLRGSRFLGRFFDSPSIQLFAAFYVAYLNRFSRDLEYEMGSEEESNVSHVLEHIKTLSLDDVELLLADSIHLTFA